jgi:hypothetical protein
MVILTPNIDVAIHGAASILDGMAQQTYPASKT